MVKRETDSSSGNLNSEDPISEVLDCLFSYPTLCTNLKSRQLLPIIKRMPLNTSRKNLPQKYEYIRLQMKPSLKFIVPFLDPTSKKTETKIFQITKDRIPGPRPRSRPRLNRTLNLKIN